MRQGRFIGIAALQFKKGQNLDFAIPVEELSSAVASIIPDQKPTPLAPSIVTKSSDSWAEVNLFYVAISPDARYVASTCSIRTVQVWNVQSGKETRRFDLPDYDGNVTFDRRARYVITPSYFLDIQTGQRTRRSVAAIEALEEPSGHDISNLAVTPDARHYAAIADSSAIFAWDYNGKLVQRLDLKVDVDNFAVSGHGRFICTGAEDGIVRLWNAQTGQQIRKFLGHKSRIEGVAFSPDGRYVLSAGGLDGTCRVWDISTGLEIRRFSRANATGMSNCVICVASSADGQFAVSGYADGTISLWKLDIDHTIW